MGGPGRINQSRTKRTSVRISGKPELMFLKMQALDFRHDSPGVSMCRSGRTEVVTLGQLALLTQVPVCLRSQRWRELASTASAFVPPVGSQSL